MQDLQHQLIGQEGVGARALLTAARHRGFEIEIAFESRDLAVGGVGVFFDPQQLLPKQGTTDGRGIEAAIANQSTASIGLEPCLMQQWWNVWASRSTLSTCHTPANQSG